MGSFDDAVAHLHEKAVAGTVPDASTLSAPLLVRVYDDVLPDPERYRDWALSQPFRTLTFGAATFHGIAACDDPTLSAWVRERYPQAEPGVTFFRRSPSGQVEPNYIHTDRDMGSWTGILYLNPTPADGDGTTFWRRRDTGASASIAVTPDEIRQEWGEWRNPALWEPIATIGAKLNRLLLFSAPLFHSRALPGNYGHGDTARLTQVLFGTGALL